MNDSVKRVFLSTIGVQPVNVDCFCGQNLYIYKERYGAIHQTKIPFVALDPVRDTIMIGIYI